MFILIKEYVSLSVWLLAIARDFHFQSYRCANLDKDRRRHLWIYLKHRHLIFGEFLKVLIKNSYRSLLQMSQQYLSFQEDERNKNILFFSAFLNIITLHPAKLQIIIIIILLLILLLSLLLLLLIMIFLYLSWLWEYVSFWKMIFLFFLMFSDFSND